MTRGSSIVSRISFGSAIVPKISAVLLAASSLIVNAHGQSIPSDVQMSTPASSTAISFNSWFTTGSPSVNGFVTPDDSLNFSDSPNKDFYRWSYRMFLWLMSPSPSSYGGSGLVLSSPGFYNVSPADPITGERTMTANPRRRSIGSSIGILESSKLRGKKVQNIILRKPPIPTLGLRVANLGPDGLPVLTLKDGSAFQVLQPKISKERQPLILNKDGKEVEIAKVVVKDKRVAQFFDRQGNQIEQPQFQMQQRFEKALGFNSVKLRELKDRNFVFKIDPRIFKNLDLKGLPIFVLPTGAIIDPEVAQSDGSVQLTRNGSLIYYGIAVNDVFAYYLTCKKNGSCSSNQFPTTSGDLTPITAFATAHGHTFTDPNALAMELKSSWVDAASLPNPNDYIKMRAAVPNYVPNSSGTQWNQSGTKTITVALLGIHIVGSTQGHPEMIWASFEHTGNTANVAYDYVNTSGGNSTQAADAVGGGSTWLFSGPTVPLTPFVAAAALGASNSIVSTSAQPVQGTNVLRLAPWGAPSNAAPNPLANAAQSNTEILSINKDVHDQMVGDIRSNYLFIGATWTIGGAGPTHNFHGSFADNVVGTSHLANSTMETFTQSQTFVTGNFPGPGCLACHKTNTTGTSHIFSEIKPLFP